MTVRRPLYYDNSGGASSPILKEMSDSQINDLKDAFLQMYLSSPSVALSVVGSGGNLGTMNDTRLRAGDVSVGESAFPTEAVTQEPQLVQVGMSRIQQTISTVSEPANTNNIDYPVYYYSDGSGKPVIRSMTLQDMYDTFAEDVVDDTLSTASAVYTISTSTTVSGYTEVSGSGTPVFTNTESNPAGYVASEIPETEDNTTITEVQNYYLHKKNHTTPAYTTIPARITRQGNIITPDKTTWNTIFQSIIQYMVANVTGYKLRYSINGSGLINGTQMVDSRLDGGAGTYQTYQAGVDDYRAQEFPDGSSTVISTYGLYVRQE